jgi:hypothetical protein
MRMLVLAVAMVAGGSAALAQPARQIAHAAHASRTARPRPIARFGDWQVAAHQEAGVAVCYAFVRARSSSLILPGRGDVVLSVAQRAGSLPAVALSLGFPIPGHKDGSLQVGGQKLLFYIAGRSAFARDGQAAGKAFAAADRAISHFPAPRGGEITDSFSLHGFSAAYAAIGSGCPPP